MGNIVDNPAPVIPSINRKAANCPPRGSKRRIISTVVSSLSPITCKVPAETAMIIPLKKSIIDAEVSASLFSVLRLVIFHPFSTTTVLRIINTAAEQVVPAIAATRRNAPVACCARRYVPSVPLTRNRRGTDARFRWSTRAYARAAVCVWRPVASVLPTCAASRRSNCWLRCYRYGSRFSTPYSGFSV